MLQIMKDTQYNIGKTLASYIKYNIAWDRKQLLNFTIANYAESVLAEPFDTPEEDSAKIAILINKLRQ